MSEEPAKRIKLSTQPFDDLATLVPKDWHEKLETEFTKPYFSELIQFLNFLSKRRLVIYPERENIFRALTQCRWENVKVVIIGQDPFVLPGQAEGLCFSVKKGIAIPPSTQNIYTELESDVKDWKKPNHGSLLEWANQGVLLLNALLTVTAQEPGSHADVGWESFTDSIISKLDSEKENLVFLLWGGFAQMKGIKINRDKHLVLKSGHPSPRSEKLFFGNRHFSQTNTFLRSKGIEPINWQIHFAT